MPDRYHPPADHITGHGAHRYRVVHDWHRGPQLPVKDCHEMVQAPDGRLFMLTNHTANNVVVYSTAGEVVDTWGHEHPGAHGLTLSTHGGEPSLWITDEVTGAVDEFTLAGEKLRALPYPAVSGYYGDISEYKPTETTVAPDGSIYVADGYGKNYVHRYSAAGDYEASFGGSGTGPAHLDCAHGVTVDTRTTPATLLVTSRGEQKLKRFSLEGQLLSTHHFPGLWICRAVIRGDLTYLAVVVTKSWYNYDGLVAILDKDLKLVSAPGAEGELNLERATGKALATSDGLTFMNPHDVCVDADNNLYVPQWYSGRSYPVKLERLP